ncbi:MAG: hypothetical protein V4727_02440 [Verrucomicrobiota bacterium]
MSDAEAGVEAYLEYLQKLRKSGAQYFLEGGQAVNYWAEYVDARIQGHALSLMRPFTSKDCDIWVSDQTWKILKKNPNVLKGNSPADGQLGVISLSEKPPRVVDILSSVYGVDVKDYPRLMQRALDDKIIRVIDPIYLFLSKCHCLLNLPQKDRQDKRHVRMMVMILPEYLSLLIADVEAGFEGALSERDLLKEIKFLKKISSSGPCRRAMQAVGIESQSLIPWDRLAGSKSTLLAQYATSQSTKND